MFTKLSVALALVSTLAGQGTGVLRVRVVLMDASGVATPVPRLTLLVSDDPPTAEPRRVRTTTDGTIELKLAPGSYTVELDEPVAFRGKAYTWTQIVEVAAGRDTVLDLTAGNAEEAASARISADSATLLTAWRDSVVEIWTPTRHAAGFVIDAARGLIATSHHAIGDASSVEVQLTLGAERIKVPGRVIVSERDPGTAVIWIDPQTLRSTRAVEIGCTAGSFPTVAYKDTVTTITASMFAGKEVSDGVVSRVTTQAIFADVRIGSDSEGGPVFAESGALLGISAIDDKGDGRRWQEAWVVPAERACGVIAAAVKKTAGASPPPAARLPIEPIAPSVQPIKGPQAGAAATPARQSVPIVSASDFDITLLTPASARDLVGGAIGPRADFGTWSEYVREADQVWLIRVSPQFEESLWKTLARGAAATQGVVLPPLKSFTANFLQLRAYCGDTEVTPIHPFIIEHRVQERTPIREGLYVFERAAFGPQCSTIKFSMFSEKDPKQPDTKAIDPKLFDQLTKS
jgi:S1-C subfamily serine protease